MPCCTPDIATEDDDGPGASCDVLVITSVEEVDTLVPVDDDDDEGGDGAHCGGAG